ncbi:MAG: 50S ribosomal protein L3 [Gammaproteobacteria bacterium]|nr:50S ribosomal protein L3 [Gammaproteobacteria bacterium]MCP4089126.1 50S ribosomal protein L3 [Gammaproteobacteria bacterium]MCP4276850.1 50S ribosomal protein L3 [Gammaproteobacteria bacterium]MCP4830693.1 50S ribosomal protein L3 [Gammaproteobacteria bacterium]MCP4928502.1 50S ribosomal protein L3 [Gammaproteobacteria bacterium]
MAIGLVGRKCGMTRVFTEDGRSIPVTVLQALPNRVTRIKTTDSDGYVALQVTTGTKKASQVTRTEAGQYAAASSELGEGLFEFRIEESQLEAFEPGVEITVERFEEGQMVDVSGTSIGKGYAGAIKRWNFRGQDATHGNSLAHRAPGSIGQNQSPGRVFKGKKMSGHMGNESCTTQNLEVVRVDAERNLILVKGAVPGHKQARIVIKPSMKHPEAQAWVPPVVEPEQPDATNDAEEAQAS